MRPLSSASSRSTVTPVRNATFGCLSASASPTLSASSLPPVVSGNASQGVAARASHLSRSTPSGRCAGCSPAAASRLRRSAISGLIGNGREGIGAGMLGLRRVMAQRATYPVERPRPSGTTARSPRSSRASRGCRRPCDVGVRNPRRGSASARRRRTSCSRRRRNSCRGLKRSPSGVSHVSSGR